MLHPKKNRMVCFLLPYFWWTIGFVWLCRSSWDLSGANSFFGTKNMKKIMKKKLTLLGTFISLSKAVLKMSFLFPRWDMLIPWRVEVGFNSVIQVLAFPHLLNEKRPSTPNNDRHITINDMTIRGYRKLARKKIWSKVFTQKKQPQRWAPSNINGVLPKTNGQNGPKMMGLGKGNGSLLKWQFLVSMLDFWGYYNSTSGREIFPVTHVFSPIYRGPMSLHL